MRPARGRHARSIGLALALMALLPGIALGAYPGSQPLAPKLEARAQRLGSQLRCAVCQGMSITDSPSQMARAQLDKVRSMITEGKTDAQIRAYFVARYGKWILLEPPRQGFDWLVWLLPVFLVLFGGLIVASVVRRRAPTPGIGGAEPLPAGGPPDPYLEAVRAELEK